MRAKNVRGLPYAHPSLCTTQALVPPGLGMMGVPGGPPPPGGPCIQVRQNVRKAPTCHPTTPVLPKSGSPVSAPLTPLTTHRVAARRGRGVGDLGKGEPVSSPPTSLTQLTPLHSLFSNSPSCHWDWPKGHALRSPYERRWVEPRAGPGSTLTTPCPTGPRAADIG